MLQLARFGALSVPQLLRICDGKCKKSALYAALSDLTKGNFVYPILNPGSGFRAYYATKAGRQYVLGDDVPLTTGVKAEELDHTVLCAEILLKLCQYENVTGISTHFEMTADEAKHFCHERIPDGIFRLTQGGEHYELALEVESSVRNTKRVASVLNQYWQTFKLGMECSGLLLIAMDKTIYGMYMNALKEMPNEFQSRVRILQGSDLSVLRKEVYGQPTAPINQCLEFMRTVSTANSGKIIYSPIKSSIYQSLKSLRNP